MVPEGSGITLIVEEDVEVIFVERENFCLLSFVVV
jgi:hypothetical protein